MRRTSDNNTTPLSSLNDLTLDDRNANRGTARGQSALTDSLAECGAGRSVVVDRYGRVVAGNKVVTAAQALDLPVAVVKTSGETLVVVQREDLDLTTDPKARRLALADNRVAELNLEWDPALLEIFQKEGVPLTPLWIDDELEQLFGRGLHEGRTNEDTAAVAPPATEITRGQLFALGNHRLLCGDATSPDDVATLLESRTPALMVTDPPYGVDYDPAWRAAVQPQAKTAVGRVMNDDRVDWSAAYALFRGAVAYVWHAGIHAGTVATSLAACDFEIRAQIIWVKQHFAFGRGHYHWKHEPCFYAVRSGQSAAWCGSRTETTVWEIPNLNPLGGDRDGENAATGHGTQKPVRLFERPMLYHTKSGEAVYEPFSGSGTAIIAAEKTGRVCVAMEIDPRYVEAAIRRWEAYTGHTARRL